MTQSFGSVIGYEFRDPLFAIKSGIDRKLEAGMVLNLSIGFQNIEPAENSQVTALCHLCGRRQGAAIRTVR